MSKHPIVVVEGPDGVGKTTLSNKLCEVLGAKYLHLTYRFKDRMHLYHGAALSYALKVAERQPVVIDRWWASEVAYAEAYRGGTRWPLLHRHLERAALKHGVSYVFCLPEDRALYLQHFNWLKGEREEMYDSGMDRVYDAFVKIRDRLVDEGRPAVVGYDLFKEGERLDSVVQSIVEASEDERVLIPNVAKYTTLSGSLAWGKYLLVDFEEGCTNLRRPGSYPFVSDLGHHVSMILEAAGIPETSVAFASLVTGLSDRAYESRQAVVQVSKYMRVVAMHSGVASDLEAMGTTVHCTADNLKIQEMLK